MSFDTELGPNEKIEYKGSIHWFIYFWPVVFLIPTFVLLFFGNNRPLLIFFSIFFLYNFLRNFLGSIMSRLVLTNKQVSAQVGFFNQKTVDLSYKK